MEGRILQLYRKDVEKIFKAGVGREIPDNGGEKGRELANVAIVDNNPRRPGCTNEKKKIQEEDETQ